MNDIIYILKHLAGQHEQKAHAGKGRGGVDFTLPVKAGLRESRDEYKSAAKLISDASDCCDSSPRKTSSEVVDKITKRSGVDKKDVTDFMATWNDGVDKDVLSTVHTAISEEFDIPLSKYHKIHIPQHNVDPKKVSEYKKIARAMYDETQEELAKRGMTEVPVYRGAVLPKLEATRHRPGASRTDFSNVHTMNSAESWTTDRAIADKFASMQGSYAGYHDTRGTIIAARIPASRVFSTPLTGAGTTSEREYIILGPGSEDKIMIEEIKKGVFD